MNADEIRLIADFGRSLDCETWRIQEGLACPPVVLGSEGWYDPDTETFVGTLLDKEDVLDRFEAMLDDDKCVVTGANVVMFDFPTLAHHAAKRGRDILPKIFAALENRTIDLCDDGLEPEQPPLDTIPSGRAFDIQMAEALDAIAGGHLRKDPRTNGPIINPDTGKQGGYSLAAIVDMRLGRKDAKKNDVYRLRYHEFDDVPLDQLPTEAAIYPVDDVKNAHESALAQIGHVPKISAFHTWGAHGCTVCGGTSYRDLCRREEPHRNLTDVASQARCAFAMALGAIWGLRVDQNSVDVIEEHATREYDANVVPFIAQGVIRDDGTENRSVLKKKIAESYGATEPCPICCGTGKVPSPANPRNQIICYVEGAEGAKEVTCDGTGLVLSDDIPRSEKRLISYGRDALYESGSENLMAYGELKEDQKIRSTYIPSLRRARIPEGGHRFDCDVFLDKRKARCSCPGPYRSVPLTLRPNPILDTGRVSYSGTILLMPRWAGFFEDVEEDSDDDVQGRRWIPSLRECIISPDGWVMSSNDYEGGELVTHAQSCLWIVGRSLLAEALNVGIKPHNKLAAEMLGISYDEFQAHSKDEFHVKVRQAAKPGNFGSPGGMGALKMVLTQRRSGPNTPCAAGPSVIEDDEGRKMRGYKGLRFCVLMDGAERCGTAMIKEYKGRQTPPVCEQCVACAERLRASWLRAWPENKPYFKYVSSCVDDGFLVTEQHLDRWPWWHQFLSVGDRLEPGQIAQHVSGRLRGNLKFNNTANGFFQALLAEAAKAAFYRAVRECYDRTCRVPRLLFPNSRPSKYAGGRSPLFGHRVPVFQHDEIIGVHPRSEAHDGAFRVSEIMIDYLRWWCPDVAEAVKVEPALMTRWLKSAKGVYEGGRLVPWEPGA